MNDAITWTWDNSGNNKEVTTDGWVYLGTHLHLPIGVWLLAGCRCWSWGAPYGARITASATNMSGDQIYGDESFSDPRREVSVVCVLNCSNEPATVYLWTRALTGMSSEMLYAIKIRT